MAAALLTADTVTLHNIPYVRDIITQRRLLEDIGATVRAMTTNGGVHLKKASNNE
jgi:UDP-N-acetylglucosamine enolpyruvyl transferase